MTGIEFFSINLAFFRTRKGITQSELSVRAGKPLSQALVSSYERGLRPPADHVRVLADALGVPVGALLRRPRVVRRSNGLQTVIIEDAQESDSPFPGDVTDSSAMDRGKLA